jgi:hypothetical protein
MANPPKNIAKPGNTPPAAQVTQRYTPLTPTPPDCRYVPEKSGRGGWIVDEDADGMDQKGNA